MKNSLPSFTVWEGIKRVLLMALLTALLIAACMVVFMVISFLSPSYPYQHQLCTRAGRRG